MESITRFSSFKQRRQREVERRTQSLGVASGAKNRKERHHKQLRVANNAVRRIVFHQQGTAIEIALCFMWSTESGSCLHAKGRLTMRMRMSLHRVARGEDNEATCHPIEKWRGLPVQFYWEPTYDIYLANAF
ncbi:MAG: hypothetical protein ACREBR_00285 [bacterium]